MRKRKVRRLLLSTLYVLLIVTSFMSITAINHKLITKNEDYSYSKSLMKDVTEMMIKQVEKEKIFKPYNSDKVEKLVSYYNKDDEASIQEGSLIYYQKTYMPSSGVIYSSYEDFDVLSIMDGKVTDIKEDGILGMMVEITHNDNYVSYYYSLKDIIVNIGTSVKGGDIIGRATKNKIYDDVNNTLIEIYNQGKSIDPEKFYIVQNNELQ